MIAPILGESFANSASLDNGRNGLASIGSTSIDTSAGISTALGQTYEAMRQAPDNVQKNLDSGFKNLLGTQATETQYEYDSNGKIIGKREIPIADAYNADGLLGKHYQRDTQNKEQELRLKALEKERDDNKVQLDNITKQFFETKDIAQTIMGSADNFANKSTKDFFGENAGTYDDIRKGMDKWLFNTAGVDLDTAMQDLTASGNLSGTYNSIKKAVGQNNADRYVTMLRQIYNIGQQKRNIEAGILSPENTKKHINEMRSILLGNGYNTNQANYYSGVAAKLGLGNLLQQSKDLSAQQSLAEHKFALSSLQANEAQARINELKKTESAKRAVLGAQAKALQQERQFRPVDSVANKQASDGNGQQSNNRDIVKIEEGGLYRQNGQIMVTFSNGDQEAFNQSDIIVDGNAFAPSAEGNGVLEQSPETRISIKEGAKGIKLKKGIMSVNALREKAPEYQARYDEAYRKMNSDYRIDQIKGKEEFEQLRQEILQVTGGAIDIADESTTRANLTTGAIPTAAAWFIGQTGDILDSIGIGDGQFGNKGMGANISKAIEAYIKAEGKASTFTEDVTSGAAAGSGFLTPIGASVGGPVGAALGFVSGGLVGGAGGAIKNQFTRNNDNMGRHIYSDETTTYASNQTSQQQTNKNIDTTSLLKKETTDGRVTYKLEEVVANASSMKTYGEIRGINYKNTEDFVNVLMNDFGITKQEAEEAIKYGKHKEITAQKAKELKVSVQDKFDQRAIDGLIAINNAGFTIDKNQDYVVKKDEDGDGLVNGGDNVEVALFKIFKRLALAGNNQKEYQDIFDRMLKIRLHNGRNIMFAFRNNEGKTLSPAVIIKIGQAMGVEIREEVAKKLAEAAKEGK